jgi:uncharacterized membrane protein AbrB (regulator of aidB expression)
VVLLAPSVVALLTAVVSLTLTWLAAPLGWLLGTLAPLAVVTLRSPTPLTELAAMELVFSGDDIEDLAG